MSYIYPNHHLIGYVHLDYMQILNANAISGPLTFGFPSITGFTGAVHALSRKISQLDGLHDLALDGVLIACYDCEVQSYRESPFKDYIFIQTRNPLKEDGESAAIVEEGRCHLKISLLIGVYSDTVYYIDDEQKELLLQKISLLSQQQRWAGGSVLSLKNVDWISNGELEDIRTRFYPAFILTDAHQDLLEIHNELQQDNPNADLLDALIEVATLHHIPTEQNGETHWHTKTVKTGRGWLVPMPVGFQGISVVFEPEAMLHNRNPEYSSQYVEALYGLGKWQYASSIENLASAFWYQQYNEEQSLYLVVQNIDE